MGHQRVFQGRWDTRGCLRADRTVQWRGAAGASPLEGEPGGLGREEGPSSPVTEREDEVRADGGRCWRGGWRRQHLMAGGPAGEALEKGHGGGRPPLLKQQLEGPGRRATRERSRI